MMTDYWFYYILVGVAGLSIGSFLNVLIYRLPREMSFATGRSFCPKCRTRIKFYDNIPILSFIILRGKCRHCKAAISPRYLLVEGLNAGLYLFLAWYLDFGWFFFVYAFLSSILLVIFFIDLDFQIIPDILTLPGIVIGLAVSFLPGGIGFVSSLIGLAIGGGVLYLMAVLGEKIFKKESMGGGDIKMAAMLGAFLGWQKVVLIFFGGALIGMLVSVVVMSFSARVRQSRLIPFGPFLAVAAFGAIVFGDFLINYYLKNFLAV